MRFYEKKIYWDAEGAMNWESLGTSDVDRLIGGKTTASTVQLMRL